jgi:hypothetical protein
MEFSLQNDAKSIPVKIYVRLASDPRSKRDDDDAAEMRRISFRIPDGMDALELLDHGLAIDGNQATFTIALTTYGDGETVYEVPFAPPTGDGRSKDLDGATLTSALANAQKALVAFLRDRGFEPQFA